MHAELRTALDGQNAMTEYERLKEVAATAGQASEQLTDPKLPTRILTLIGYQANEQLTEELDDTRTWLQRAMAERVMKGQMEQLEKMMGGGGDAMTVETNVTDIRVNEGPPRH